MKSKELLENLKEKYPHQKYIDCLACSNSFSTDEDELVRMFHQRRVDEDYLCEHFG